MGLEQLSKHRGSGTLFKCLRGRVLGLNKVKTVRSPVVGDTYDMTFKVAITHGDLQVDSGGVINDAILLQPMVGDLLSADAAPTGLVVVPEPGSMVMLVHDGIRWVIIGCYSGPAKTAVESADDPQGQRCSYNPGFELPAARVSGLAGLDTTPDWAFGISPGDVIMGKGLSRIKVCAQGALIGANLNALSLYKDDGEVLHRMAAEQTRMVGYQRRHYYWLGQPETAGLMSVLPLPTDIPKPTAYVYQAEVLETNPYATIEQPVYISQRGHIGDVDKSLGRASIHTVNTTAAVAAEAITKLFSVIREAVIQPLAPSPPTVTAELNSIGAEKYDFQVDADGSFRLRSGNRLNLPGTQTKAPTAQMGFSFEFDAITGTMMLRVGEAGAPAVELSIQGRTPADAVVNLTTGGSINVTARDVSVTAAQASVEAATIDMTGDVSIKGALSVTGAVDITGATKVTGLLSSMGVILDLHTHTSSVPGQETAPPTPTPV